MFFLAFFLVAQSETATTGENQQVEDPPTSRFTWTIENFSRLNTKKHYSEVFIVGGFKWYVDLLFSVYSNFQGKENKKINNFLSPFNRRVLIFPKGNNVDHLSMYLDVADSASLPYGWSRYAQFSLSVVNQMHSKYTVRKGTVIMLPALQR